MTKLEKGPRGLRRGRGARERILSASQQLFRDQGINRTGMDPLCAVAEVSKHTLYQNFAGKDELIAEHLRRFDPDIRPEVWPCRKAFRGHREPNRCRTSNVSRMV